MPSSPPLRWADLAGARVGVWGLGVEGRSTLARLAADGIVPVACVDDDPARARAATGAAVAAAAPGLGILATGEGGLDALLGCDVVVKAPGIPRPRPEVEALAAAGVVVAGGLGLWLEGEDPEAVIGITGTKGKSTTASVAGHLGRNLGADVAVVGNLGTPPWDPSTTRASRWIVEVSSYQATDLWSSPAVVVVTSLHPDHLTWHGSVERYYADKLSLCGRPGARVTLANGDDERLREREAQLHPGLAWIGRGDAHDGAWIDGLGLRGAHNRVNALLARAALAAAGIAAAEDDDALAAAAPGYEGLPSRLRTVAVVSGVELVDDSLSTNVLPTLAALDVFAGRPVALLAGGHDRGIDYVPLAAGLAARAAGGAPTLVLALPPSGARIRAALGEVAGGAAVEATDAEDVVDAVRRGHAWARRQRPRAGEGDGEPVVLLSPAAPSFGQYRDYRDRAAAFTAAAQELAQGEP